MKRTIQIAMPGNTRLDVDATAIGCWGYHPTVLSANEAGVEFSKLYFTVTHVPTGYCITTICPSARRAAALIRDIHKAAPLWDMVTEPSGDFYLSTAKATRPVITDYRARGWA